MGERCFMNICEQQPAYVRLTNALQLVATKHDEATTCDQGLCQDRLVLAGVDVFRDRAKTDCSDLDTLVILAKNDSVKQSVVEKIKTALTKNLGKAYVTTVGTVDPDPADALQRYARSRRRAFGCQIEEKMIAFSIKGISEALSGRMKYLAGDSFFNRWPVPVTPVKQLPQCSDAVEKLIFANASQARDEDDLGEEGVEVDMGIDPNSDKVIPFPLEGHHLLLQEMANIFRMVSLWRLLLRVVCV
jgi:hypothetical protein